MVSKQKNADSNVFRIGLLSLVGVVAGLLPLQLRAATQCYWNGLAGDGLWTNAVNWTGRVPQDGDLVYFRCGGTHRVNLGCSAKSGTCIAVCGMELLRETA